MDLESAIRIIENTVGFDDETTGVGEAWNEVLRHLKDAIPREAVQAAVDRLQRLLEMAKRSCRESYISSFERAIDAVFDETGVTPTEVQS